MLSQRVTFLLAGAALAGSSAPAAAQVPDQVVINIMRECAKIDDPTARLACYDNNIRSAGGNPRSLPGQMPAPRGGGAPVTGDSGPGGFGAESIKTPDRFQSYEQQGRGADEVRVRVAAAQERQPGVYLVTLEGGAQWEFSEAVGRSFRPPRAGDTVEIERAALGSFLMMINNQQGVRVRRIR